VEIEGGTAMQQYNKALAAVATAVVTLIGNFGVELSEQLVTIVNSVVPFIGALLVYFIPNRPSKKVGLPK
jgi:hypothetical protein